MSQEEQVQKYALKAYPRKFKEITPIVTILGTHIEVKEHVDASPIILSLTILN